MTFFRDSGRCAVLSLALALGWTAGAGAEPGSAATGGDAGAAVLTVPAGTPEAVIEATAQAVLAEMSTSRDALRADPAALHALVDRLLLPAFDINYAGRVVLGKFGRDATSEQRKRFIRAFYESLLKTYGEGLLEFTADRMRILPPRGAPDGDKARVRTEVILDNGTTVPVDYSLRLDDEDWKVYDVVIEGISYLSNYRKMVTSRIREVGLDGLIRELESGNLPEPEG